MTPQVPRVGWLLDVGGETGADARGWLGATPLPFVIQDPLHGSGTASYTGPFSVILCLQTVDHFSRPIEELRQMAQVASPDAWLVIDYVPSELVCQTGVVSPPQRYKMDHPFYWTEDTLTRGLSLAGWRVITTQRVRTALGHRKGILTCQRS